MSSTSSSTSTPFASPPAPCPLVSSMMPREMSCFAQSVQQVETCLANLQRLNEQIAALAAQRRKIQDELRGIQSQFNEEFDRILKPARPAAAKVISRAVASGSAPALRMEVRAGNAKNDDAETLSRAAS